jgi:3-oxoacyl-[acyl-carrier protein] reductase
MNLNGKVALVTGGSRGIGRAIALELARNGASVIINFLKDVESAQSIVDEIRNGGHYAIAIKRDVSIYDEAKLLAEEIITRFGKVDILINNTGISKIGLFIDMTEEDWDNIINTNLKSMFNVSHNIVKHMLNRRSGSIVNISSIWGGTGAACEVAYSASKGGVNSFTKALAKELAPSNIRVNAIAPGVINTEMNNWLEEDEKNMLIDQIPLGTFGEGSDIGKLSVFLSSDDAKYITGQVITVDGGFL